jgi:rhodanese-related sulfurtransferase
MGQNIERRTFIKGAAAGLFAGSALFASGCAGSQVSTENSTVLLDAETEVGEVLLEVPPSSPDPNSLFGEDLNININTIDNYLNRPDVVYRDMRMFIDPADFEAIGGDRFLPDVLEGFKIVPWPYVGTLSRLPVEGAYEGETLITLEYDDEGNITSYKYNYEESELIINDLFPKDKPIFLVCGGAGYSADIKKLLILLGWDERKLYNVGGMWSYKGDRIVETIIYAKSQGENNIYATWRADYATIDFDLLNKIV